MKADWGPLRQVLSQCRQSKMDLPFWWRDDDAVAPSPALDHLQSLSLETDVPVHLAVIPGLATKALAGVTRATDALIPVVHGWKHSDNAPPDEKKSEFGVYHASETDPLLLAIEKMREIFAADFLALFVPPWNRIDPRFFPDLSSAGYHGVSTFLARPSRLAATGLVQINTHVDPIDWKGTRGLKNPDLVIAQTVDNLKARLRGQTDKSEPLGYLTHHLVHTPELWEFSKQFLKELRDGGAVVQPISNLLETPDEQT